MIQDGFITPNWPVPKHIKCLTTTRQGGLSDSPFDSFNLGVHVGDEISCVEANRLKLMHIANLPSSPQWLSQTHSTTVAQIDKGIIDTTHADAVYTQEVNQICAVLTADCLPVLFCSDNGDEIAAAHAGWRGLADGILENTVAKFKTNTDKIMAWFGPAIGPSAFEVGQDVFDAFVGQNAKLVEGFKLIDDQDHLEPKYIANIYLLAKIKLNALGIINIFGGDYCTVNETELFYSYRRDGKTGRMASLIWKITD